MCHTVALLRSFRCLAGDFKNPFAIDSGCGSIVSVFFILPFKLRCLKNKKGAGILPLNVPNDFL